MILEKLESPDCFCENLEKLFWYFWPFLNLFCYFWPRNPNIYIQRIKFSSTINSGSPFLGPKLRFSFSLETWNSRKAWTSETSDGAKNGLSNIRSILKKDSSRKSMPRELTRASGVKKSHVFISEFCIFPYESRQIPSSPGRIEIPAGRSSFGSNVRNSGRTFGKIWSLKPKNGLPGFLGEAKLIFWLWVFIFWGQKY